MPMSRYEIRNEFTLADPELYRAADKDDPEALLEGIAMAGLVGVLRQLGDLAEFAAEIFHDLHEEVLASSARGHGLMTRVQQLEAEVPLIEKAFLSQKDHSSFSYSMGVDWHPNLRMDQNLVTQGDLPRFVMDSYEECRGPPRLFLLDKYDVAGAGACLKRYTDPSFFILEISSFGMTSADVQRKKKVLKAKKKGSRWRNGDAIPEVLTSHVKLDQLFMKESIENGVCHPARRVKLKRSLNGFPFDLKPEKSYMEKLLEITSTDDKVLHEVSTKSVILPTDGLKESDLEVLRGGLVSAERESMERKRNPPPSSYVEEISLEPSVYEPNEMFIYDKISEAPNLSPDIVAEDRAFSHDKVTSDKDMAVDVEGRFTSYQQDDISSEMENYVDAPSTMESEVDTDSELRVKSDFTSSSTNRQQLVSDANEESSDTYEEQANAYSSDSQSNSGNISSGKELPTFSCSDSPSTSTENPQSELEVSSPDIVDISPYRGTLQEDIPVSQLSKSVIFNGTDIVTNQESDLHRRTYILASADSTTIVEHFDLEGVDREGRSESSETSPLEQEEKRTSIVMDLPCSLNVSELHLDYNSQSFFGANHLIDESDNESVPCLSTGSDNLCRRTDSPVALATDFLRDHFSDVENLNPGENESSTLNICNALPLQRDDSLQVTSIENLIPNELDGGFPNMPENSIDKYPEADHNGDRYTATSEREKLIDELDNEDSVTFSDAPCNVKGSVGNEPEENFDSEDFSNSILDNPLGSQNLVLLHVEHPPGLQWADPDFEDRVGVNPDEQKPATETPVVGRLQVCKVELLRTEIPGDHFFPGDSTSAESSCCPLENLEKPVGTSYFVEKATPCPSHVEDEVTEISTSPDPTSLNKVHVQLDATDILTQPSETAVMDIAVPTIEDKNDDISLLVDTKKMIEENIPPFDDSDLSEPKNDKSSLSGNHGEPQLVEIVGQREPDASVLNRGIGNSMDCDKIKLEIPDTTPNADLILEVEHNMDFVNNATVEPYLQQNDMDIGQESCQQSGLGNHPADAPTLTYVGRVKGKIELRSSQLDNELPGSDEINSDPLPRFPINHQQMLVHDEQKANENSASTFSLVNCSFLPSKTNLPAQTNQIIYGSELYEDSLSFTFPCSYPFSETNQINSEELPPLPPLPPVQWRMGKLQRASSASDGVTINNNKLASLGVSPPTTSKNDAGYLHEDMNQSRNQIDQVIRTENIENSFPGLVASVMMPETVNLPEKTEIEQQQQHLLMPNESLNQIDRDMTIKEEKIERSSSSMVATVVMPETIDLPGKTELAQQQQHLVMPYQSLNEINQDTTTKEEKIEHSSSSLVATVMPETNDLPAKTEIEHQQQHLLMPKQSLNQIDQDMTTKEENIEHDSSSLVATVMMLETIGLPEKTEIEQQQQHILMPKQSLNQIDQDMTTKEENIEHSSSSFFATAKMPETIDLPATTEVEQQQQHLVIPNQSLNQIDQDMTTKEEKIEHRSSSLVATVMLPEVIALPEKTELEQQQQHLVISNQSLNQFDQDMTTKEEKIEHSSSSLVPTVMLLEPIGLPAKTEIEQQQQHLVMLPSESGSTSLAVEDVPNGGQTAKLPRPRNPLIDAVTAVDRSKLRKVTERVRPELHKVDERDSVLEQIRTKSFNLKPALASRPSIRAPKTNLNVAAILEKANAIRQALVDSDEDEDNWSDS